MFALLSDYEIVLASVKEDGNILSHASKRLQDDYDIVLTAVKQRRSALRFASNRLKAILLKNYQVKIVFSLSNV